MIIINGTRLNREGPASSKDSDLNNDKELRNNVMGVVNEDNLSTLKPGNMGTNINNGEKEGII